MSEVDLSKAVVGQQGITGGGDVATLKRVDDEYHWGNKSVWWGTTVNGRASALLGPHYDIVELLPLAPAPASAEPGDVITGPGPHKSEAYLLDECDDGYLCHVAGRGFDGMWYGLGIQGPDSWDDKGFSTRFPHEGGNITGPYTEPPDPTRAAFNRLCDLLSSGDRDGAWKVFSEKGGG